MAILSEPILGTTPFHYPNLYEVVNGEIKERKVGVEQSGLASDLFGFLWSFVRPKRLGKVVSETLFHLKDGAPERQPDLAFVSDSRWPFDKPYPKVNAWPVVPNLAVEAISPSNSMDEVSLKIQEYFFAGVECVWVILTSTWQIQVYYSPKKVEILTVDDVLRGDPVLPGFELPLREIFPGPK
jgi:Uma2 family endonuclease